MRLRWFATLITTRSGAAACRALSSFVVKLHYKDKGVPPSTTSLVSLAVGAALTLTVPALAQSGRQAQVRVAHVASDAPNVDVSVNGEPVAALQNVPYGTISPYLPLPAGSQQVTVYPAGDSSQPVIDTPVDLAAGGTYTIGAVGLVSDGSLRARSIRTTSRFPPRATLSCAWSTPRRTPVS